mmetsp:Transcript_17799/g.41106  ORF Transcript_17799/g.41106 Transcript_17799/m.41106 type:complete len:245 (-) Transcript_17799:854-1588(-)
MDVFLYPVQLLSDWFHRLKNIVLRPLEVIEGLSASVCDLFLNVLGDLAVQLCNLTLKLLEEICHEACVLDSVVVVLLLLTRAPVRPMGACCRLHMLVVALVAGENLNKVKPPKDGSAGLMHLEKVIVVVGRPPCPEARLVLAAHLILKPKHLGSVGEEPELVAVPCVGFVRAAHHSDEQVEHQNVAENDPYDVEGKGKRGVMGCHEYTTDVHLSQRHPNQLQESVAGVSVEGCPPPREHFSGKV